MSMVAVRPTLDLVAEFFGVDVTRRSPIEIPKVGRTDLARFFEYCGFMVGAEIGVEQGKYAEELCRANPAATLHCVDAWQAYRGYREHVTQAKLDGFYQAARERLATYRAEFHRAYSTDAAGSFKNRSLDFVFIDGNHRLDHVIADLHAWVPKVRPGGIVSGHDWCRRKQSGYSVHVVEAVTAYVQAYHIDPLFILGSKEVRSGEVRDRPRSWFWVQP